MPRNQRRDPLGSLNVFLQTDNFKKIQGVPFNRIQKFSKKSRIVPKNPKGDPLVYPLLIETLKNLWFSAKLEPTLSCF